MNEIKVASGAYPKKKRGFFGNIAKYKSIYLLILPAK